MTAKELEWLKNVVRPTALAIRPELLRTVRSEKSRHWKLRGSHQLGLHFERGFFRGLKHAEEIIDRILEPEKFQVKERR